jgi:hypothetical protein
VQDSNYVEALRVWLLATRLQAIVPVYDDAILVACGAHPSGASISEKQSSLVRQFDPHVRNIAVINGSNRNLASQSSIPIDWPPLLSKDDELG